MLTAGTGALRQALGELEQCAATLADADATTDEIERTFLKLQKLIIEQLRKNELALWTLAGLPEVPRGRP